MSQQQQQQQSTISNVIRYNSTTRIVKIVGLLPVTRPEQNQLSPLESRVYYIAGAYLATQHFNQRNTSIIPLEIINNNNNDIKKEVSSIIDNDCNIQLELELRDTQYSRIAGARQLMDVLTSTTKKNNNNLPVAIVGAGRSDVSETISTLSGQFDIPQISPHSSASSLDDKVRFPYFCRTTPSNAADGKAAVDYFEYLQVSHIAVLYILDINGIAYQQAIQYEASLRSNKMHVVSIPYSVAGDNSNNGVDNDDSNNNIGMISAFTRLKESGLRYIFAIIEPATWKEFITIAIQENVIGNEEYFWLYHSGMVGLVPEELNKDKEYNIARAIHGSAVLLKDFPDNPVLDKAIQQLETNTQFQSDFINTWSDPSIFNGFDFRYPGPNYPQYINYDSVMTIGLAACSIDKEYFTGKELYEAILRLEFQGASDYVSFYNHSGSRKSVPFQVDNIRMIDKGNNTLGFIQVPVAEISAQGIVTPIIENDFIYWDNTTNPPLSLPAIDGLLLNENFIPDSIRIVGWILCAITITCSIGWSIWTWKYRNSDVVKSSQPFFLIQLCFGTLIMSSAIIPLSLQEGTTNNNKITNHGLDIACKTIPWLLFLGYSISFSALLSKSWRINSLFHQSIQYKQQQRRQQNYLHYVSIWDVMLPLIILIFCNVVLLTLWTILSPLVWKRTFVNNNLDQFGRSVESYGQCKVDNDNESSIITTKIIISLLGVVNGFGLLLTNYQSYKTRSLPTAFNESYYVAITNACLLEALVLGIPILILSEGEPASNFIVKAILVTLVCFCILLPTFIPKHMKRNALAAARAEEEEANRRNNNNSNNSAPIAIMEGSNNLSTDTNNLLLSSSENIQISNNNMTLSSNEIMIAADDDNNNNLQREQDNDVHVIGRARLIRHDGYYIQRKIEKPPPSRKNAFSSSIWSN